MDRWKPETSTLRWCLPATVSWSCCDMRTRQLHLQGRAIVILSDVYHLRAVRWARISGRVRTDDLKDESIVQGSTGKSARVSSGISAKSGCRWLRESSCDCCARSLRRMAIKSTFQRFWVLVSLRPGCNETLKENQMRTTKMKIRYWFSENQWAKTPISSPVIR